VKTAWHATFHTVPRFPSNQFDSTQALRMNGTDRGLNLVGSDTLF
jgi:hypothetical protein